MCPIEKWGDNYASLVAIPQMKESARNFSVMDPITIENVSELHDTASPHCIINQHLTKRIRNKNKPVIYLYCIYRSW